MRRVADPTAVTRRRSFAAAFAMGSLLTVGVATTILSTTPSAAASTTATHHPHVHRRFRPRIVKLPLGAKAGKRSIATFGPQPASAHGPLPQSFFTYAATSGAVLTDHVAVLNYSLEPLTLQVYPTDVINLRGGALGLAPVGAKPKDAGGWIAIRTPGASGQVRVPRRSAAILPFTLRVPRNASPGDHAAGIVTQLTAHGVKQGEQVTLHQRVATRAFIRVSGPLHPGLTIESLKAAYNPVLNPIKAGSTSVSYTVVNTGNVDLAGHQKLAVSGWFGKTGSVPKVADLPLLLPGGKAHYSVKVPQTWPEIRMKATVTISPLTLLGAGTGRLPTYSASTSFWAIPWLLILIIVLLLVAIAWFVRRRFFGPTSTGRGAT